MAKHESNAVILARVSSKSQEDEGYSIESQLKLLDGYCRQKQLTVVRVFKIAETASKEHSRKVFNELLAYLNSGEVHHLAIEKTDRLTRNMHDAVAVDEWLDHDDRRCLHAVKENLLLHKEAKSDVKFMWNIHLSVAKKYADNLREEAMKGWAEKLAQGWLPAPPPPGYMTVVRDGKRIHVPNPDTKPLIQKAFELYLDPAHSIATIADEMELMGVRNRKGRPYNKSQVHNILANPFYIGTNRFNGTDYPGAQEPIISKKVFEQVQVKMRRKLSSPYRKHNPVLKNMIRCSDCNKTVTWQLQKGRYYGACQRKTEACKRNGLLREDKLEATILGMLEDLVSPSEQVIEWLAQAMRERHKTAIADNERLAASIQSQIDRIERMDRNLYDDKLAGDISAEAYQEKHDEFTSQKSALYERLANIDQTLGKNLEQKLVLLRLSQKAAEIYAHREPSQKRMIISKLFLDITYKDGAVSVTYTDFARMIANKVLETHKVIGGSK